MSVDRCPMCEDVLINHNKCDCGWTRAGTARRAQHAFKFARMVGGDYIDAQCNHFEDGTRCDREGYMSDSRTGHGPFYCGAHYRVPEKKDPLGDYVTKTRGLELVANLFDVLKERHNEIERKRTEQALQALHERRKREDADAQMRARAMQAQNATGDA